MKIFIYLAIVQLIVYSHKCVDATNGVPHVGKNGGKYETNEINNKNKAACKLENEKNKNEGNAINEFAEESYIDNAYEEGKEKAEEDLEEVDKEFANLNTEGFYENNTNNANPKETNNNLRNNLTVENYEDKKDSNNPAANFSDILYEEKKRKILLIHILKNIKKTLHRQNENFNNFLSFLSENYENYEKFTLLKNNPNKNNLTYSNMLLGNANPETIQSFLSIQENNNNKCLVKTQKDDNNDIPNDDNNDNDFPNDDNNDDDFPNDDNNTDDDGKKEKGSKEIQEVIDMLKKLLESDNISFQQKEYLKLIIQVLELEGDLLDKEKIQVELNKDIINVLMGKSNELKDLAIKLSNENGESEGSQRVDLAQNIVSNLLNLSVELKNTGNIVYNNIQGQGELLQTIDKTMSKAGNELKNIRVHTAYKNGKPTDDNNNNDDNNDNNDNNPNNDNVTGAGKRVKSKYYKKYGKKNKSKHGLKQFNNLGNNDNKNNNLKHFNLDNNMKNHFFNIFKKDEITLKKLYTMLSNLI
ncbi:rhoptry-associated leucine zipper-like protein 1, putative [Plasmodium chabaudi chabaudi]|uniref:Rhoptry-associated leucine zipper-like protein 1, putative n=1 Tax=Plasmodium chabaudi chabaudi TaxID=31271 RepID=A0A1C6YA46_PLACU|nr:rhoptry-associated leucine zipper-like protein 1, putative [Plasmodium chabaudi chabaudi]